MTMRHVSLAVLLLVGTGLGAQTPDRSRPPAPGPVPALALPPIEKRQLSNGLPVWIVEQHEVPLVSITLLSSTAGSSQDPRGQYGVASLTAAMLVEGAGSRSSLEIADAMDFLGAGLSASSGVDSAAVRLRTPVSKLADALPVMADVALRPTFPAQELDRLRQERLTSLLQSRDSPETIVGLAFSRVVFGPSHRYGTAFMGTADTIKAFTPDALRAFYQSAYRPDTSTLIVVGDVRGTTIVPLLETHFGSWRASGTAPARTPPATPPARTQRAIYLVDKPGAPQTQIRIGGVGVPRSTPDFFPIQVMNTILGGAFTSRLNLNLREKHGYTYGASSYFDMRLGAGPYFAVAGVQTDKTAESLTEFFNELNGMLTAVPADELARAKNYVALRFPAAFETNDDISGRLVDLIVYGLPDDYFSRYVQNIQAVTAEDVQRVAKRYLQPDRVAVVVVGDRQVIEPRIRALNLGPIVPVTLDEVFSSPK
jgi:predicted Zn-dependent peptidase